MKYVDYQKSKVIKVAILTGILSISAHAKTRDKIVYGNDDRQDVKDVKSTTLKKLAKSTAAQIEWKHLEKKSNTYGLNKVTLEEGMNVCKTEKYSQQNAVANCSGFLVAPDLLVTAGHCVPSQVQCDKYAWVFDYKVDDKKGEVLDELSEDNVYKCKTVVVQDLDYITKDDYALIQLDRPVKDREPLSFRTKGKIELGEDLVVIGHPSGLPTKVAGGASVKVNDDDVFFMADLDTFGGNSGSAVFNGKTGDVEGILVRGARDYVPDYSQGCYVVNACDSMTDASSCGGESSTRISRVQIKKNEFALRLQQYFEKVGEKSVAPSLDQVLSDNTLATATFGPRQDNALMIVAASSSATLIKTLLEQTTLEIDAKNAEKDTALLLAIKGNNADAVEALLEAGADFTIKGKEGKKAKRLAKKLYKQGKADKKILKLLRKFDKWYLPGKA